MLPVDLTWLDIFWHLWLLYYYVSLALRENILRVNGSNIRDWWIFHHYISIAISITALTWPRTPTFFSFRSFFLIYASFQGAVQVLQNAYQEKRLYATRALGRAGQLDVAESETAAVTSVSWHLRFLLPLLFIVQGTQAVSGFHMLKMFFMNINHEWQMPVVGSFLILLAGGNLITTVLTVVNKNRKKKTH